MPVPPAAGWLLSATLRWDSGMTVFADGRVNANQREQAMGEECVRPEKQAEPLMPAVICPKAADNSSAQTMLPQTPPVPLRRWMPT